MNKILLSISTVFMAGLGMAQMSISTLNSAVTEDFNNFNGSGFATAPTAGQLDSDTWMVTGMSTSAGAFGGEFISGDFARGGSNGIEGTGGIYAFFDGRDSLLGIHPGGADGTPGT